MHLVFLSLQENFWDPTHLTLEYCAVNSCPIVTQLWWG